MPRLPLSLERARTAIAAAEIGTTSPEVFGESVLRALRDLAPYDSARMFGVDSGSLLLNRLIAATASDEAYRGHWLRNIYLAGEDNGYFAPHHLLRSGSGAMTYLPFQDDCWGMPEALRDRFTPHRHTAYFHESLTPIGGSMRLGLRARGQWIGMIDLVRREAIHPFSLVEFASCRAMGNHIAQLLDAILLREAAVTPIEVAANGSGVIYIAADRRVAVQTPAADRWLAAMHDCRPTGSGELTTPLTSLISAFLSPQSNASALAMTVPSRAGPLRIEASAGQIEGEIAIVIAPLHTQATVQVPEHWPLTERQREIVALLLQGSSTKEIARQLGIGVPTVETHLGRIYGALGVDGRHALLGRYFQTAIRPRIDAPRP